MSVMETPHATDIQRLQLFQESLAKDTQLAHVRPLGVTQFRESASARIQILLPEYKYALENLPWFHAALSQLRAAADVHENWNGHHAPAPNETAISRSREALDILDAHNFEPSGILPTAEGGIAFLFGGSENNAALVELYNDGDATVGFLSNRELVHATEFDPATDLSAILMEVRTFVVGDSRPA